MLVREILSHEKDRYNSLVSHPIQSWEWGEFKESTGVDVIRLGVFLDKSHALREAFQITFHSLPALPLTIGYFPKGGLPDERMFEALVDLGTRKRAIYIKLEPNVLKSEAEQQISNLTKGFDLRPGRTVFTPHTFQIDLTKTEDELLAAMKPKTRYNLRLAQKRGVSVQEDNSKMAFETYLRLTRKTSRRQRFYAHDENYHRLMWETLHPAGIAHLLTATFQGKILVTWIVFVFGKVIYYPYGASSGKHRELMASNLMMWEAMRFGKRLGCDTFDMWGSLGPDPDKKHSWFGFHKFKEGYGGKLVEFMGSYDLVLQPKLYSLVRFADTVRWKGLRILARFR